MSTETALFSSMNNITDHDNDDERHINDEDHLHFSEFALAAIRPISNVARQDIICRLLNTLAPLRISIIRNPQHSW